MSWEVLPFLPTLLLWHWLCAGLVWVTGTERTQPHHTFSANQRIWFSYSAMGRTLLQQQMTWSSFQCFSYSQCAQRANAVSKGFYESFPSASQVPVHGTRSFGCHKACFPCPSHGATSQSNALQTLGQQWRTKGPKVFQISPFSPQIYKYTKEVFL